MMEIFTRHGWWWAFLGANSYFFWAGGHVVSFLAMIFCAGMIWQNEDRYQRSVETTEDN